MPDQLCHPATTDRGGVDEAARRITPTCRRRRPNDAALMTSDVLARQSLHRVCAHVLGRRRFAVSGRFGLRAGPAGIVTPAYGDEPEVLRIAGPLLLREIGSESTGVPMDGATLRTLAAFAGADIDAPFDCGNDAPAVGDDGEPLWLPNPAVSDMADWFSLAWRVLDELVALLADGAQATTVQLWPEHFDAATTLTLADGTSLNVGFSPGDAFEEEPYVYLGPWDPVRPGDPAFWNAPFGASRPRSALIAGGVDAAEASMSFLQSGLALLAQG